jgi:hypothetical protein
MTEPGGSITVHKLDAEGAEVFRYVGKLVHRTETSLVLEAIFDMEQREFHGLTFRRGDRFVETHYSDRWYNVLAVHDVDTGLLKGWYCNITRPAKIENDSLSAEDLSLDLVVLPDGSQHVLDEDEFVALNLNSADRAGAREALKELQEFAEMLDGPFENSAGS